MLNQNPNPLHPDWPERLPNKAFDSEYSTQFRREMEYLRDNGIYPVFTKKVGEYRIPTYKYTKTADLFAHVSDFYRMIEEEKKNKKAKLLTDRKQPYSFRPGFDTHQMSYYGTNKPFVPFDPWSTQKNSSAYTTCQQSTPLIRDEGVNDRGSTDHSVPIT